MYSAAKVDEQKCLWCLKSLQEVDDLKQFIFGQEILCISCRRKLSCASLKTRVKGKQMIRQLLKKKKIKIFILYEENENFLTLWERLERLKDVEIAPAFLHHQSKAIQFLKSYQLVLEPIDWNKKDQEILTSLERILISQKLSYQILFSIDQSGSEHVLEKMNHMKKVCLVVKNIHSIQSAIQYFSTSFSKVDAVFCLSI